MEFKDIRRKILGEDKYREDDLSAIEELNRSFIMAAKCRYLASARLKHIGQFSSHTTTILSLGLIFIPLVQFAGLQLSFPDKLLGVLQIFLAVSVLVYSVINTQGRYSLRAEKLNQCGDKIKELQRQLSYEIKSGKNPDYQSYHSKYLDIEVDAENHSRLDYMFARLDLTTIYHLSGCRRAYTVLIAYLRKLLTFTGPGIMFCIVFVIILDALKIYTPLSSVMVPLLPNG